MTMKSVSQCNNTEVEQYKETAHDVVAVAEAALGYILIGDGVDRPYNLRGLGVYGVISMLREHDDILHGDESALDEDQRGRLDQIESDVDHAVKDDMHFYPFGHANPDKFLVGDIARNTL